MFDARISQLEKTVKFLKNQICCNGIVGNGLNGLSLNDDGNVVLGQDLGDPDNPAALTSDREIPMGTFSVTLSATDTSTVLFAGGMNFASVLLPTTYVSTFDATGMQVTALDGSKSAILQVSPGSTLLAVHDNSTGEHFTYSQATVRIEGDSNAANFPSLHLVDAFTSGEGSLIMQGTTFTVGSNGLLVLDGATSITLDTSSLILDAGLLTTAPSTTAAGTVTNRYGGATNFLGDPTGWLLVTIGVNARKIPFYT